jgi:hypothetical protein
LYRVWWENLWERDHLVDPGVNGSIVLRLIYRKVKVGIRTGLSWLRIRDRWQAILNEVIKLSVP